MSTEKSDRIAGIFRRMAGERAWLVQEYENGLRILGEIAGLPVDQSDDDVESDEDDEKEGDDPLSAIIVALEAHNIWGRMEVARGVLAELTAQGFRIVHDGDDNSPSGT